MALTKAFLSRWPVQLNETPAQTWLILFLTTLFLILATAAIECIAQKAAGFSSFPQSVHRSFLQYIRSFREPALQSQGRLVAYYCDGWSASGRTITQRITQLSGQDRAINELCVSSSPLEIKQKSSIVLLHGYGSGLAYFAASFDLLSTPDVMQRHGPLYALDWLGMGLSSRPTISISAGTPREQRIAAEAIFLDALDEWRMLRGLDQLVVVAHSFGAYLAVRYAQRCPSVIKQLILISPVGMNENPYLDARACLLGDAALLPAKPSNPLPWFIQQLWDTGYTPFDFLRWAGPFGPKLMSAWSHTLVVPASSSHRSKDCAKHHIHDYAFRVFSLPASTERMLSYILAPGAHAREALMGQLPVHVPILLIYGKRDWMSVDAGFDALRVCNLAGGQVRMHVIEDAGHHAYNEALEEFGSVVVAALLA